MDAPWMVDPLSAFVRRCILAACYVPQLGGYDGLAEGELEEAVAVHMRMHLGAHRSVASIRDAMLAAGELRREGGSLIPTLAAPAHPVDGTDALGDLEPAADTQERAARVRTLVRELIQVTTGQIQDAPARRLLLRAIANLESTEHVAGLADDLAQMLAIENMNRPARRTT